jgi:hypothetical protein
VLRGFVCEKGIIEYEGVFALFCLGGVCVCVCVCVCFFFSFLLLNACLFCYLATCGKGGGAEERREAATAAEE